MFFATMAMVLWCSAAWVLRKAPDVGGVKKHAQAHVEEPGHWTPRLRPIINQSQQACKQFFFGGVAHKGVGGRSVLSLFCSTLTTLKSSLKALKTKPWQMVWPPKTFGLGEVNKQRATPSQKSIHNTEEVFSQLGYVLAAPPAALIDSRKHFFSVPNATRT